MSERSRFSTLAVALVASLVVNALLVGLVLGNVMGRPHHNHDRRERGPRGGGDFAIARGIERVVPEEDRAEIRSVFREAFRSSREQFIAKREAREGLNEALAAEAFNPAAVDRAFANMREADRALTERFQTVLSEQIGSLSDAERAELVTWMQEVEARRRRHFQRRREDRRDRD